MSTKRFMLLWGLVLLALGAARPAAAYDFRFCFRWPVFLEDAGFGEDFAQSPTDPFRARGGLAAITANDHTQWLGNLDAAGCSPVLSLPAGSTFDFFLATSARVGNGIEIEVRNPADEIEVLPILDARPLVLSGATGGTFYYVAPQTPRTTILAVAAFVLQRFNGGISQTTFTVNDRCRPDGSQCCNCSSGGEIWLNGFGRQRKFLIGHEIGHRLLAAWTGGFVNNCSFSAPAGQPCRTGSSHALTSIEFASCGAMEGWAHFVATDAFNDHQEGPNPDALFRYWGLPARNVDAERGPVGGAQRYMETTCVPPSNEFGFGGFGVELDWLRLWWNYHTNGTADGSARPSHAGLMDEIDRALPWASVDTYGRLLDGILTESGATQQSRFREQAVDHGCDH